MIVTIMKHLAAALVALAVAAPLAPLQAADTTGLLPPAREQWLELADAVLGGNEHEAAAFADPLQAPMELCEEAGCTQRGWQTLGRDEADRLRALLATEDGGAEGERSRLGKAIALLETMIGGRNGTWRDHAANERQTADEPGQLDCIAESINTHTYLDRLTRAGLIRHHHVGDFIHRYTVVLQHVAVDIIETATDERFAVDSWVGANGEQPEILPYGDWRWEWGV